jgi:hypothetical protein
MVRVFVLLLVGLSLVSCTVAPEPGLRQEDTPAVPPGENEVALEVVDSPITGVLAFAPVYINDQGPFNFAVDTGASRTVIGREVADRLRLPDSPAFGQAIGVTGESSLRIVRVEQWRVGGVDIPTREAAVLDLPAPGGGLNIEGLLGSDVLSAFGVITLDYDRERLVFRPRSE